MDWQRHFRQEANARSAKWIIIAIFATVLLVPLVGTFVGIVHLPAVVENRTLAPWPAFDRGKGAQKYVEGWQLWFDDHFGLRSLFIRLATQIDYSVFDHSSRVHIGKDGWLYYRNVLDVEKPQVEQSLPVWETQVVSGVRELNRVLKSRGVTLIFAPVPLKDFFYPEFLPVSAPRLPKPHRFERLYHAIQGIDDLMFVDTVSILRETAKTRTVFHRTDFHWNDPAAFEVTRSIIDELSRRERRSTSAWDYPLKIVSKPFSGGQANFMPLFSPPSERALFLEPTWQSPPRTEAANPAPFLLISRVAEPTPKMFGPIAVLGDSFFDGMMRAGFMDYFTVAYRGDKNTLRLPMLLESLPPDCKYVLLEFIEISAGVLIDLSAMGGRN